MEALKLENYYTYEDWLALYDGEHFYELYDGEIYMLAAPSRQHQEYSMEMARQFANFLVGKPCRVYHTPFAVRLYKDRLYTGKMPVPCDNEGRIRMDDLEMRRDVQEAVSKKISSVTPENVFGETDLAGFKHDFMETHGFDLPGIDYDADVNPEVY